MISLREGEQDSGSPRTETLKGALSLDSFPPLSHSLSLWLSYSELRWEGKIFPFADAPVLNSKGGSALASTRRQSGISTALKYLWSTLLFVSSRNLKRPGRLERGSWTRLTALSMALSLFISSCASEAEDVGPSAAVREAHERFLMSDDFPPAPREDDRFRKEKADVIVLPTVTLSVWAIGVIAAYVSGVVVYYSNKAEFDQMVGDALAGSQGGWDNLDEWLEAESHAQAQHVSDSLERVIYRSESSDFYAITGNDYLHFLNATAQIDYLDPRKLKDLLDGKVRPLAGYAREFLTMLRELSVEARHADTGAGICMRAQVSRVDNPEVVYMASARANGPSDVIPAALLASLKATVQCGTYDVEIMEYIYGYYEVKGPLSSLTDIFFSHIFRTARLLYMYVDACQLPPQLTFEPGNALCE